MSSFRVSVLWRDVASKRFAFDSVLILFSFPYSRPGLLEVVSRLSVGASEAKSEDIECDEVKILEKIARATRNNVLVSFTFLATARF